jgi:glycosyltransferase 2 family protein
MKKINTKIVAKLVITSLLVYLIISKVDIGVIFRDLSKISLLYVFLLLLINVVMVWISCVKWQLFLRATKTNIPIRILMVYYYIGYFFNNLLPSSIGGDVARMYLLGKNMDDHTKSVSTVFLERYTGVIALIALAIIAAALNERIAFQPAIMIPLSIMALVMIGSLIFFSYDGLKIWIYDLFDFKCLASIKSKFDGFYQTVSHFRSQWNIIGYSMLYSFAFHVMTIINTLATCWAINISPGLFDLAVTVPIILFVTMIPITIGSIGLWEGTFAFFFLQIGIPAADGVAVALVLRAVAILMGLLGGIFYLFRRRMLRHPPAPITESGTEGISSGTD